MYPTFELFGKTIGLYQVASLAGIFVAGIYACRNAKKRGFDDNDMIVFLLIAGIGAIFGGHLLYGFTNYDLLAGLFQNLPGITGPDGLLERAVMVFGGSVFYGGLLGGTAAAICYAKKKNLDLEAFSDMAAPAVPLFHVFGRVGCFLGGCCYGVACRFGITYTNALTPEANGVSRFPVQLAEAAFNFILFLTLDKFFRQERFKGKLFAIYLLVYPVGRFLLEFLRGDEIRGFFWVLSTSQWISIGIFIASAAWLARKKTEAYGDTHCRGRKCNCR